jgi:tagaturonate epimerase
MKLVSLAPRFIGEFEKGVDYKGDLVRFQESLAQHAHLARTLGPYKLSLHSGSDKLSIYPAFARATGGLWHVKTAGTSYLEAIRAVARHNVDLFKRIIELARSRYDHDRATYHVSATLNSAPPPDQADVVELEKQYLERWQDVPGDRGFTAPGRQILHTTFGSVLTDPSLKAELMQTLREHPKTYQDILDEHFSKHLMALRAGM